MAAQTMDTAKQARVVPLRQQDGAHGTPDELDGKRIHLVRDLRWASQDALLLPFQKQVEENVRMLSGRQWDVWNDLLGAFVDVSRYMDDGERRWRQRPVVDRLLPWFRLELARLTENPPIIGFQPSTADRSDAMLAEVMDTLFKTQWREAGMSEVWRSVAAWVITGGHGFFKTRLDTESGPSRPMIGPAVLSMGEGEDAIQRVIEAAPYDMQGNALAQLTEDGSGYDITGEPAEQRDGMLAVDVIDPLSCRGQWGRPWHKARWHIHRSYLTQEEVWERYEVECEADSVGLGDGNGYLERLLFGTGFYGAAGADPTNTGMGTSGSPPKDGEGYVCVDEMWEGPCRYFPEGRLLTVTKTKVLHDSARPFQFPYTSPIRRIAYLDLPGRPAGTSPQERLNWIQKTINRGEAQILEHRNLLGNPKVLTEGEVGDFTNAPGEIIEGGLRQGQPTIGYLDPPQLGADVWRTQAHYGDEFDRISFFTVGGKPPTENASGELVKELRFDSDRPVSTVTAAAATEFGRWAEDAMAILKVVWPEEKILTYAGEDQIPRTIAILPEMWEGSVNVIPDIESMLPEGRGDRQARAWQMYQAGVFGLPGSPEATRKYLEIARFPHLGRTAIPGGVDRVMAAQNVGRLVRGEPAEGIAVFEWYDCGVHIGVLEEYMKAPEYLQLSPEIQGQMVLYRDILKGAVVAQQMDMARIAGQMQMAVGAQQATQQQQMQQLNPPPAPGDPSKAGASGPKPPSEPPAPKRAA